MAYLPSGTAIIPADKTDEIINNSTSSSSVTYEDHSTFSPTISITLGGETTKADAEEIVRRVKQTSGRRRKRKNITSAPCRERMHSRG